jgi:hypothetical protein
MERANRKREPTVQPKVLSFRNARRYLDDPSDEAVDKLIKTGQVDVVRIGRRKYLTVESLDRLIAAGGDAA